jgi:hypothetical protein
VTFARATTPEVHADTCIGHPAQMRTQGRFVEGSVLGEGGGRHAHHNRSFGHHIALLRTIP